MAKAKSTGQFRIIAGEWRGRRLPFPVIAGLRPSTDRVRETLFNWLAPRITGARCLDLFAGSGALGLEALSRGAAHCDFIDQQVTATRAIEAHLKTLGAGDRARVITSSALTWTSEQPYDLVFIDPPFDADLAPTALNYIIAEQLLAPDARVYIEQARSAGPINAEPALECLREKTAGGVRYQLFGPVR